MLEHHNTDSRNQSIPSQTLTLVERQAQKDMEQLIAELIQSAFTSDEQAWFELLGTDTSSTTDEQLEQFLAVVDGVNRVFDYVNTEDHEEINEEQLDEIARLVF